MKSRSQVLSEFGQEAIQETLDWGTERAKAGVRLLGVDLGKAPGPEKSKDH
jgi:hypothetical protein